MAFSVDHKNKTRLTEDSFPLRTNRKNFNFQKMSRKKNYDLISKTDHAEATRSIHRSLAYQLTFEGNNISLDIAKNNRINPRNRRDIDILP